MASQILVRQYQKALRLWPKDPLRPDANFPVVLAKRVEQQPATHPTEAETNALFSLLENRYAKRYTLQQATWRPASNPEYYDSLIKEMHEVPSRSWFGSYVNSWKGFLRWK